MNDVVVGEMIPELRFRVDRHAMALFSLVTHDPNPIHFDVRSVQAAGLGDRLVNQGGLNAGYVLNALRGWSGQSAIRSFSVRFSGNAFDGDTVVAGGTVVALDSSTSPSSAEVSVWLRSSTGAELMSGRATVVLASSRQEN